MEKSGKKGKIPQQDWPSIIKRYEAGETLASIARTYDCSPPAISYILSRSRARDAPAEATEPTLIEVPEPQLAKENSNDIPATKLINETPETAEATARIPKARDSLPIDDSGPEAMSVGPGPALNGEAEAPKIAATMAPSRPAKGTAEVPIHAASSESGNAQDIPGKARAL